MLIYPHINPVIVHIGPIAIHWYGVMYLMGLFLAWLFLSFRIHSRGLTQEKLLDILFYAMLGVLVGGRLGYMLFYDFSDFIHAPWRLFMIWQGGMSFHGGLIGVLVVIWIYSRVNKISWIDLMDFIAPVVPLGLAAGRLGNFINGELWGRVTTMPWGMVFPNAGPLPRHPSQLYEFFLEGILLFIILWVFSAKPRPRFAVSGCFLLFYGLFRFIVEFFRQPDIQIGFVAFGWMTKGQLFSLPMILIGLTMLIWAYRRPEVHATIS